MSNGNQPLKRVKKGFGKKTFNRIIRSINRNRVLPIRPGWEQTEKGIIPPPISSIAVSNTSFPWELSPNAGSVTVTVGTILKSTDKHNDELTCTNPTASFIPVSGGFLYIKISDVEPTTFDLDYSNSWPIANDYTVNTTSQGDDVVFDYRIYPLYAFVSETQTGAIKIADNVFAVRVAPKEHLALVDTSFQTDDNERIGCPAFMVYHKASP